MISLSLAVTKEDIENVRDLFEEYAASLNLNLEFQSFDDELANLPGDYAFPEGFIIVALYGGDLAGCVALRKLEDKTCEMKRLYVRPRYRKLHIGRVLAETVIVKARKISYQKMRLDTVPLMKQAQNLYQSLGFYDIKPYYHNPVPNTRFMELIL
jgi:ribosomal protein S18 acetylase RimI-like enzyme